MKKFTTTITNAVEPAAPASVWCKGIPGKGGMTTNSSIVEKKTEKEECSSAITKSIKKENA